MLNCCRHYPLIVVFTFLSVITYEINSSEIRPRGVSLSRAPLYVPAEKFTCFDGSLTIKYTQVNDDYCDCADGSDEPGTPACPNGVFHCANAGHQPLNIPSSRVNDGICDCCDGSDEYGRSDMKCINSCFELGQSARLEAQKRIELLKIGSVKRGELIERGNALQAEKKERIEQLKKQKIEADQVKAEKEKLKSEIEQYENVALEKYRKVEEEEKLRKQEEEKQSEKIEAELYFAKLDSNQDGRIDLSEIKVRSIFDTDKDGEVSNDEAKYFLDDQEEVENIDSFIEKAWPRIKPYTIMEKGLFQPPKEQKDDEDEEEDEESEDNVEEHEEVEPEEADDAQDEAPSNIETTEEPSREIVYDEDTQALINQANDARREFNDADRAVRDIEKEISDIQDYLAQDYGYENEFAMLHGNCFEYTDREYVYKLCLFDKALQIPRNGGSETRLGVWANWSGDTEHKYMQMLYERGTSCWNGPQRTTRVHLSCGVDNQVTNVHEPNRCEYEFHFETPAVCYVPPSDQSAEDEHDEL